MAMRQTVNSHRELAHGDRIRIQYDLAYGPERNFSEGWTGTYLTTENLGRGPLARVKADDGGEHRHVNILASDVRVTKIEDA